MDTLSKREIDLIRSILCQMSFGELAKVTARYADMETALTPTSAQIPVCHNLGSGEERKQLHTDIDNEAFELVADFIRKERLLPQDIV